MPQPIKIPSKVKAFMKVFEKMGFSITLVDKDGKPIKEQDQ